MVGLLPPQIPVFLRLHGEVLEGAPDGEFHHGPVVFFGENFGSLIKRSSIDYSGSYPSKQAFLQG